MQLANPYDLRTHLLKEGDEATRFAWQQDTSGALSRAKAIRDAQVENPKFAPEIKHLASIPTITYESWMREYGISLPPSQSDLKWIMTKVNDPEFKYFRTGTKT